MSPSVKSFLKYRLKISQDTHQNHSTTCHFPFGYQRSNKFVLKNLKEKERKCEATTKEKKGTKRK